MTKKETAEMDSLREQLRLAKAMRFTEEVKPDLPEPEYNNGPEFKKGYLFNAYGEGRVAPACSSTVHHCFGSQDKTTTQGSRALYSTRLLALRGLRHTVELECAKRLANIDAQIEKETAGQSE